MIIATIIESPDGKEVRIRDRKQIRTGKPNANTKPGEGLNELLRIALGSRQNHTSGESPEAAPLTLGSYSNWNTVAVVDNDGDELCIRIYPDRANDAGRTYLGLHQVS